MTETGNNNHENEEKPVSELDDESLADRLFPNELLDWVKDLFRSSEDDEE